MNKKNSREHIAIVGIGCRFPDADDAEQFWNNIKDGRTSFTEVPADRWNHDVFFSKSGRDVDKTWTSHGAFIEDVKSFSPLHYGISPRRLEVMDPQHRLLIEAVRESIQDAGYETRAYPKARTGAYFGLSVSEYKNLLNARILAMQLATGHFGPAANSEELRDAIVKMSSHTAPMRAFAISGVLTNMAAASVSQTFDLGGPSYTIDAACASASVAVHDAVAQLRAHSVDAALAGGAYINLTPDNLIAFTKVRAISRQGACRPFDKDADGFVQGDGIGVLFLKRLSDALADHDRIYAVIRGSGCNNDGRGEGPMTPRPEGQKAVLRAAYEDADCSPASVSYFEAHGTGTAVGDPVEFAALGEILQDAGATEKPRIGSVKANIGHTMSAAGIAGLIKAIKIVEHREAPPHPGYNEAHPALKVENWPLEISKDHTTLSPQGPLRVAASSFGFGGTNAHFVLEEAPIVDLAPIDEAAAHVVIVSAPTPVLLGQHLRQLATEVADHRLADVAYTLNTRRSFERYRVVLDAKTSTELEERMTQIAGTVEDATTFPLRAAPFATVYDRGAKDAPAPKLAFLFPGQGAQKVGLLAGAKTRVPLFGDHLETLADACKDELQSPLLSYLYPDIIDEAAHDALTATEVCQPAMAALGLALGQTLSALGIHPHVSLGHSLGEFAALAHGKMITGADAVRMVARRGRAMADLELADQGTMAAVSADKDAVENVIGNIDDVVVANLNRPGQVTISGATEAVKNALEALRAAGIEGQALSVSHAFHSSILDAMGPAMAKILDDVELKAPEHTVASCIRHAYSDDTSDARATLIAHATSPVRFTDGLQQAKEAGADTFVQLGAGGMLAGFARATLGRDEVTTLSLVQKDDDAGIELLRGIATLIALGAPGSMAKLYDDAGHRVVSLAATPLDRQPYWLSRPQAQPSANLSHWEPGEDAPYGVVDLEVGDKTETPAPAQTSGQEALVALFSQQNALLEQHAQIIAEQNRLLMGGAQTIVPQPLADTTPLQARLTDIIAEPRAQKPEPAPAPVVDDAVDEGPDADTIKERVFEIVAKVSAFPRDSLRGEQRLIDELGFDSLMVADLGSGLDAEYPTLGGLPQSLFSTKTTLGDVAEHVATVMTRGAEDTAAEVDASPLSLYDVEVVEQSRPDLGSAKVEGTHWLVTEDDLGYGAAASKRLAELGAKVLRVRFTKDGVAAPSTLSFSAPNVWPESFVEGLFEAVKSSVGEVQGILHAAAVGRTDTPLSLLHPLAKVADVPRFGVVTGLGGKLALEPSETARKAVSQSSLLGYTKALARERKDAVIRALDIDPTGPVDETGRWLVDELLSGVRDLEVGLAGGRRHITVLAQRAVDTTAARDTGAVLITGGAGEIASKVAKALAKAGRPVVLVGRRPQDAQITSLLAQIPGAKYFSADVTDVEALKKVAEACTTPITCAIHAAGFTNDAPVTQTALTDIDKIVSVKAGGHAALIEALSGLKTLVTFSSWAGRFGNAGQTGYSAANDLVDRHAVLQPDLRTVSIAWPPWTNTKMVEAIPSTIRNAMLAEGVTFVDDDEGVDLAMSVLNSDARGVVVAGRNLSAREVRARYTETVSPQTHPYLNDHRLKDAPVLPLASASDLLLHVARTATGSDDPVTIERLELLKGIEVSASVELRVDLESSPKGDLRMVLLADGTPAYRASAKSASQVAEAFDIGSDTVDQPFDVRTFYDQYTFHGPMLQGIERIEKMTETGIVGTVRTGPIQRFIPQTKRSAWAADPLLVDSSFQLAGYWAYVRTKRAGFPIGYASMTQYRPFGDTPVRATFVLESADEDRFVGSVRYDDDNGEVYAVIRSLEGRLQEVETKEAVAPDIEIPKENWQISEFPEVEQLEQRLEMAKLIGIENPYFNVHEGTARNRSVIGGVEMVNYSSYNYLGFSGHPEVVQAAQDAVKKYGTSVSASRIASGERPIHRQLEIGIAQHLGVEDSIVFVSGHATNVTTVGHMLGKEDIVFHDSLIHDSILQGIYLSGAARRPYPHEDMDALERTLSQVRGHYRRALIAAEGIYSMDGDVCDLPRLIELKKRFGCMLLIDEAHSAGVLGHAGRGVGHHFEGVDPNDVDLWMGTLSKSYASCGGYIAGSERLVRFLKYTAPGFVYSAGITPPNCAAALKSLELMQREPETVQRLRDRSKFFLETAKSAGLDTGLAIGAAVIPVIVGNSMDCVNLSAALFEEKINVQPIVYPAVEDDAARLRFFLSSTHTEEELVRTVETTARCLAKIRAGESSTSSLSI